MKPRNLPGRKFLRKAHAAARLNLSLTAQEIEALQAPQDIRIRVGAANRDANGQPLSRKGHHA